MKANEAPEKLYVDVQDNIDDSFLYGFIEKGGNEDIEYTRSDAFIKKAAEWLEEHKEDVETEDNGIIGWIPDRFIKNFKNYMKGE